MRIYNPLKSCYRLSYWKTWVHFINPETYWRAIKYFCQRGYRGYADCDTWNLNSYMTTVLLGSIKHLQEYVHGYPQSCSDYPMDHIYTEDDPDDTGFEKWQSILSEMIEGLEAAIELEEENTVTDGVYDKRPIKFIDVPGFEGKLVEMEDREFNHELYESWRKPLEMKRKRGMLLIVKYWDSLWD